VSNIAMRTFSWRWALPLQQIALATAALVYAPSEWKARPHLIGDCTGVGRRATWPPPLLRISYALNFPALTAAYPAQFASWSDNRVFYRREPFIWLSAQDSLFLLAIGALWYWLGAMLDGLRGRRSSVQRSKSMTIARQAIGCVFAVGVVALGTYYSTLSNADRPYRQIGPFGLIWGVTLFCYFVWRLVAILSPPTVERWVSIHRPSAKLIRGAVSIVLLIVTALFFWIHFQASVIPPEQLNSWRQLPPPVPPPPPSP